MFVSIFTVTTFICSIFLTVKAHSDPPNGSVTLSTLVFDKVIKAHQFVLVKFDEGYPFGAKQDAYAAVSETTATADNFLSAEVRVQDYGDKTNEDLAERFKAKKEDYPLYMLFKDGNLNDPQRYTGNTTQQADIIVWIVETTGLYFPLEGCVEHMDKLSSRFMHEVEKRAEIFAKMTGFSNAFKGDADQADHVKFYVKVAKRILDQGKEFVQKEQERLKKLLGGTLSAKKRDSITRHVNILSQFRSKHDGDASKTEL